ncbi:ABC transporter ATP-binding protein [Microbacterium hydrocarbonoxydans]|uniref:ABC-2 type transport system ATP-binding protein n=1 Tax=Microbacterium hydrocarbonoxydans TaxID=273678 RepID=A0A1H4IRI9_9MICO|nr:ABC-2 type transport system ATP-binding protein [Microbacterium hydrocarbonoxydans]
MTSTIEIDRLHKRYGTRIALHELDLAVRPGTVFGLIGPNGAGKTTTLRTLVDVIRPSSGSVRVLGVEPRLGGAALRRRIGYVPGELHLEGRSSGHRMLAFYAQVSGERDSAATLRTARELADRLGVDLSRSVRTLSKGNKQKIGLIQAFMHRPELLILDEPTSGLDPLVQREFLQMVREAKDAGQTVLLSSHVLSEIQQTADEVAVLANGRVVAEGDVASLRLGSIRRIRAEIAIPDAAAAAAAFDRVPGLTGLEVHPGDGTLQLAGTIEGAIDPFIKALAPFEVRDLTVEEPDLEESVLRLYGSAAASPAPDAESGAARGAASDVEPGAAAGAESGVASRSASRTDPATVQDAPPSRRARRARGDRR